MFSRKTMAKPGSVITFRFHKPHTRFAEGILYTPRPGDHLAVDPLWRGYIISNAEHGVKFIFWDGTEQELKFGDALELPQPRPGEELELGEARPDTSKPAPRGIIRIPSETAAEPPAEQALPDPATLTFERIPRGPHSWWDVSVHESHVFSIVESTCIYARNKTIPAKSHEETSAIKKIIGALRVKLGI